jgi:hypothetical protein
VRVTVDIDEGLLQTAKDIARDKHQSLGRAISDLMQKGLMPRPVMYAEIRNGIQLLPRLPGAKPVTDEHVKELLELDD